MRPELLKSQFEALDEPSNGIVIDASLAIDIIVNQILDNLKLNDT
jgi:gluconate kinase